MRTINLIVIHCAATKPSMDTTRDDVDRWHKARGWTEIGYHFFVKRDGTIQKGRDITRSGAHAKGHNSHSIGVCYAGGIDEQGKPEDNRTEAQKIALLRILETLTAIYTDTHIIGHSELSTKACPCFNAEIEYKHLGAK